MTRKAKKQRQRELRCDVQHAVFSYYCTEYCKFVESRFQELLGKKSNYVEGKLISLMCEYSNHSPYISNHIVYLQYNFYFYKKMLKVANVINDTNPCCQHFQLCLGTISNPQTIFLKEETELGFFHF